MLESLFLFPAAEVYVPTFWLGPHFFQRTKPLKFWVVKLLLHTSQIGTQIPDHLMTVDSVAVEGDRRAVPGYRGRKN